MVTEAKTAEVEKLKEDFTRARVALVAKFSGVTVEDVDLLRKDLRSVDTKLKVVKNTLARRAVVGTQCEGARDLFRGPVAVAFGYSDDIGASAKKFLDFAKAKPENVTALGGIVEGAFVDASGVKALADLPPKPVAQAMLLGLFQAPARNMLGVLEGTARKFIYALQAYAEKKKGEGQS
jgi:large subunit ribosomal protein L10